MGGGVRWCGGPWRDVCADHGWWLVELAAEKRGCARGKVMSRRRFCWPSVPGMGGISGSFCLTRSARARQGGFFPVPEYHPTGLLRACDFQRYLSYAIQAICKAIAIDYRGQRMTLVTSPDATDVTAASQNARRRWTGTHGNDDE